MGSYANDTKEFQPRLKIENGVLIKCKADISAITIPDEVTSVHKDAFDDCENVKINRSEKYIETDVTGIISDFIDELDYNFKNKEEDSKEEVVLIYDISPNLIEKCIGNSISNWNEKENLNKCGLKEIDAAKIRKVCNEIDLNLFELPENDFGIVLIKNLNKETVKDLPANFMYNIFHHHQIYKKKISSNWLIMIEIGQGVNISASEGADMARVIQGAYYNNIPVKRYLDYMKWEGKLVE